MRLVTKNKDISSSEQAELSTNHQKLIDATIETIAKRGLGETTISHVAQAAKVSQGYANFRFKSKENLLLSSLKFISDEYKKSWGKIFEDQNIIPKERVLKIIENDFSSKIASRNKIAVWIAFYSEVKFRPSYLSICQHQDEIYSDQMEKLIQEILDENKEKNLSAKEISETYLSMVDGLWQRILFDPKVYSHEFCKKLVYNYFKTVFPKTFS
tara:strand:+ start:87 stop:725 length:639 start_codon:yes stop_codon:yes gene_type:complete